MRKLRIQDFLVMPDGVVITLGEALDKGMVEVLEKQIVLGSGKTRCIVRAVGDTGGGWPIARSLYLQWATKV